LAAVQSLPRRPTGCKRGSPAPDPEWVAGCVNHPVHQVGSMNKWQGWGRSGWPSVKRAPTRGERCLQKASAGASASGDPRMQRFDHSWNPSPRHSSRHPHEYRRGIRKWRECWWRWLRGTGQRYLGKSLPPLGRMHLVSMQWWRHLSRRGHDGVYKVDFLGLQPSSRLWSRYETTSVTWRRSMPMMSLSTVLGGYAEQNLYL